MPRARVEEPSCETVASTWGATSTPGSPLPSATYSALGGQPAAAAASTRSSPSATNSPSLSRRRLPASLRISLRASLWGLVIGIKKGAAPLPEGARWLRRFWVRLGRRGLSGALGKSAERLGVAHGDVGQDLAVQLDARQLQAVDERGVRHALGARGRVDAGDPQAAEVALAVAAVPVRVGVGLHDRFLGALVGGVRLPAEALGPLEDLAALLAGVDGALDAGHRPLPPSSFVTVLRSAFEIVRSRPISRLRLGDFFSRMWLENAWRPWSLPVAVFLKRFLAPECDFIFGMPAAEYSPRPAASRRGGRAESSGRPPDCPRPRGRA